VGVEGRLGVGDFDFWVGRGVLGACWLRQERRSRCGGFLGSALG
jgi:hypothetical protein